ncbi:hypothetical protein NOR_07969 [Metarhizium rileyi]|uniref:Uncharacterized protein n=1 Tax=Metarhizium rileyi (strain RCEF 4871) TaxID=1649241 RepID=A0A166X3M3_METRR|nr:hypothetical protein NOR_07969 [Metarhizium rileyi RCEF 4871]
MLSRATYLGVRMVMDSIKSAATIFALPQAGETEHQRQSRLRLVKRCYEWIAVAEEIAKFCQQDLYLEWELTGDEGKKWHQVCEFLGKLPDTSIWLAGAID